MTANIIDLRSKPASQGGGEQTSAQTPKANGEGELPEHLRPKETLLRWEAPEFIERPKREETWIGRTILVALPLAALFLFLKNVLGVALVVIGSLAFLVDAFRKPRTVRFAITDKGVEVDGKTHSYAQLASFWIFADPPDEKTLSMKTKRTFGQHLVLPIGATDTLKVRAAILPHLPEEKQESSAIDAWLRKIGY